MLFLQQRYGAIPPEAKTGAGPMDNFRLLVDGVRDPRAFFTVDPTGRVTSWSVGADRMFLATLRQTS